MDRTQSNYSNQLKRLSRDKKRADFILIYYSLALIIYALSGKYYPELFDENWISYSSIILSVIVLIYSIVNSRSEYSGRISSIQHALNDVKRIKREVGALPKSLDNDPRPPSGSESQEYKECGSNTDDRKSACDTLNDLKKEYDTLVNKTEIRDDIDFYYTILQLCRKHGINPYRRHYYDKKAPNPKHEDEENKNEDIEEIEELLGYISEINPKMQLFHIWLLRIWHGFLYLAPFLIFVAGILFNGFIKITVVKL